MSQTTLQGDVLVGGNLGCKTFSPPAASIVTAAIAGAAVTAPKLTTTLATGFIPLSLHEAREMFTNDYGVAATGAAQGSCGLLGKDTTPILERVNVATDKQAWLKWAAANVDEVVWQLISPPDLDVTAPVNVYVRARMSGGADTPVVTVSFFEDVGGSNLGGSTGALAATIGNVSKAVTVTADPSSALYKAWAISIKPAAHAVDAVEVVACWIEYSRR